ncbi:MAG: hypothetical protein KAT39_00830 [Alphaproteobacteria bacterium]|nr:hypothetical protein [Alphaproteobacteria bacterium]
MTAEAQWQALLGAAILGVDRGVGSAVSANGDAGVLLQQATSQDPAEAMLAQAAILSVYCRAGRRIAGDAGQAPKLAPETDRPACSARAGRQLAVIMSGEFSDLLPEWCALADSAGLRAPDELLPALLRRATLASRHEGAAIRAILGERGRWLAAQDPRWSSAFADRDNSLAWDGGDIEDRVIALSAIRQADPARAREMLAESWDSEAADDRTKLLPVLAGGLSQADEDFLESALDDRKAKVREASAELLALLPVSRYAVRMTERVRNLIKLSEKRGFLGGKTVLEVTLPENPDKAMKRDGLSDRQQGGLGKKASLLLGIIAGAPLDAWDAAKPSAWLAAAMKSDWRDAVLWGWAQAARRQGDVDWAGALLDMFHGVVKSREQLEHYQSALPDAMAAADQTRCEAAVLARLSDADQRVAGIVLSGCTHGWSLDFSRKILIWLRNRVPVTKSNSWQLRELVKWEIGKRMDSAMAIEATQVADEWRRDIDEWKTSVGEMADRFSQTLEFRAEMKKELNP